MHFNMTHHELGTESVSPVTLSSDWSRVARLLLLASLSAVGSIGNVFMISAVMIEDYLRKRGNAFVVNVALADFLVSGLLVPTSAVVILAGLRENATICRFQWFLAALCFLVTVLSITAIAFENYARLCCSVSTYEHLTPCRITTILLSIWLICAVTSGLQFTGANLSFDYCTRKDSGLIPYQLVVGVVFVFLPISLTLMCYVRVRFRIRGVKARGGFRPPVTFGWDCSLMRSNLYSFVLFVVFWMPFGVVLAVGTVRTIPDRVFYNLAWFAISKSCVNSVLYCVTNRHFRGAYVDLFHYCCCKTTVSFSRRQQRCNAEGGRSSGGDVRVHIIPGYNMYCSPQRGETHSKRVTGGGRVNGREVYEL